MRTCLFNFNSLVIVEIEVLNKITKICNLKKIPKYIFSRMTTSISSRTKMRLFYTSSKTAN